MDVCDVCLRPDKLVECTDCQTWLCFDCNVSENHHSGCPVMLNPIIEDLEHIIYERKDGIKTTYCLNPNTCKSKHGHREEVT